MLFLFTVITLIGQAVAQDTSSFDPDSINLTTKDQWCQAQTANCPTLCGGLSQTKYNSCTGSSLSYTCTCSNGTGPSNIAQYLGTLPNFICEAAFSQCHTANPESDTCKACGTLALSNVPAAAASTPSSPSASFAPTTLATGVEIDNAIANSSTTPIPMNLFASSTSKTSSSRSAVQNPSATSSTATTSVTTSSVSKSPSDTNSTTASSGSSNSSTPASPGLPTLAKVGIGVGVPVGVTVFASMIVLAYRFGQRKQRTDPKRESNPTAMDEVTTVMRDDNDTWVGYVPEIHGAEIPLYLSEIEGSQALRELEGSLGQRRQELP